MGALKNAPGSRFPYRPRSVWTRAAFNAVPLTVYFVIGLLLGGYLATL